MIYQITHTKTGESHHFKTRAEANDFIEENGGCHKVPISLNIGDKKEFCKGIATKFPSAWEDFVNFFKLAYPETYNYADCWVEEITWPSLQEFYFHHNIISNDKENNPIGIATCFKMYNRDLASM